MSTWQQPQPPVEYREIVYLEPGKQPKRFNVKFVPLDSAEQARAKLAQGMAAWVRVEDAREVGADGADG